MGASWVEVDSLLRELETLMQFPHADALMPVVKARDTLAQAAMLVSVASLSDVAAQERGAQDALARARVCMAEARTAIARAQEAVQAARSGLENAQALVSQARSLRARDRRPVLALAPLSVTMADRTRPAPRPPERAPVSAA